jgi:25S rRNA (adenine2142-N1)-methyltransferase
MGRNSNRRKKKASSGVGAWRPLASYKPLTSQRAAREITSQFHLVTRELDVAKQALADARSKKDKGSPSEAGISIADAQANVLKLTEKLESIGGRERYQQASVLLTDKNKSSSKWVFSTLTKLGLRPKSGETRPKTLEIGAINTQILSCPWLDVTSIDIEARAARIIEQDFFELELM